MGWSCGRDAGARLDSISKRCNINQNSWRDDKGNRFFYETGREQRDGAICGTIYKYTSETHAKKSSTFRIESNGRVSRGPAFFRKEFFLITIISEGTKYGIEEYTGPKPITEQVMVDYLGEWLKQWLKGGVNEIIQGTIPYPNMATVINPDTGETIFTWRAPMFMAWH